MLRLSIILLFICSFAYGQTGTIANGEGGGSSRTKINETIVKANEHADTLVVHRGQITAIMDSLAVHRGELNDHTDSITALRASIILNDADISDLQDSITAHRTVLDSHTDSIAAHRTELDNLSDSISDHRTDIDANLDSIAIHRAELDNHTDSLAVHRTELNAHTDSITDLRTDIGSNTDSLFLTRSGTNLSPKTAGDDFLLRTSSEVLAFGDGDTYVVESVDDILNWYVGGSIRWTLSTSNFNVTVPITPTPTKAVDFGGVSNVFDLGWVNRLYLANVDTYIDTTSADMTLTSDSAGTVYLFDIARTIDSIPALRTDIDANLDSIAVHRTEIDNLTDSIAAHRVDIDANSDSITVHKTLLDSLFGQVALLWDTIAYYHPPTPSGDTITRYKSVTFEASSIIDDRQTEGNLQSLWGSSDMSITGGVSNNDSILIIASGNEGGVDTIQQITIPVTGGDLGAQELGNIFINGTNANDDTLTQGCMQFWAWWPTDFVDSGSDKFGYGVGLLNHNSTPSSPNPPAGGIWNSICTGESPIWVDEMGASFRPSRGFGDFGTYNYWQNMWMSASCSGPSDGQRVESGTISNGMWHKITMKIHLNTVTVDGTGDANGWEELYRNDTLIAQETGMIIRNFQDQFINYNYLASLSTSDAGRTSETKVMYDDFLLFDEERRTTRTISDVVNFPDW